MKNKEETQPIDEATIRKKVDTLDSLICQLDVINMYFDDLLKQEIPEEIRQKIEDIEAERKSSLDAARDGIAKLTDVVKADVIRLGKTVRGAHISAVYSNGRRTVKVADVERFARTYPEAKELINEGNPYVSIK